MSLQNEPQISRESYERARRRVIARTVHTAVAVLWVLLALIQIGIWYLTTPAGYFWPVWPILGTFLAVAVWGVALFASRPGVSERRIQAEMIRMQGNG